MEYKDMLKIESLRAFMTEFRLRANSDYNMFMSQYNNNQPIDIENLKYFLLCSDRAYSEDVSPLSNEEYDTIQSVYEDLTGSVIRGDMVTDAKVEHVYPDLKGTIKKCHYITEKDRLENSKIKTHKSLEQWIYECLLLLPAGNHVLMISPKYDGVSIVMAVKHNKIVSAITRGDIELNLGDDKTNLFVRKPFDWIPEFIYEKNYSEVGIKFECIMDTANFVKYNKKYGNNALIDERSAINSILSSKYITDNQMCYVSLVPLMYEIDGVVHPFKGEYDRYVTIDSNKSVPEAVTNEIRNAINDILYDIKNKMRFKCDGIVIRFIHQDDVNILGRDTEACINNYERAYKFPPEMCESELLEVVQDIGLLGKVSFTAKIKPVTIKNKVIKSISLGSRDRVETLDLHIGDKILVKYDIIPYLTKLKTNENGEKVNVITHCPVCGEHLEMKPDLMCVNLRCPSRIIGKIYNWCDRLNIDNIGEETIKTLFYHGLLQNIDSLYNLETPQMHKTIVAIPGFGETKYANMIKALHKANTVPDYLFLGSIGIPSVSTRIFRKILSEIPFDEFYSLVYNKNKIQILERKLLSIPGIKHKTCSRIIEGMHENKKVINTLLKHIKIIKSEKILDKKAIVFTGIRNKEFEKHLEGLGYDIADAVTKNTYMVIAKDLSSNSSKLMKAREYLIPIVDIGHAYSIFKFNP